MNIFVLNPASLDASRWAKDFARDISADSSPWGFAHAKDLGHKVHFSRAPRQSRLQRIARRVVGIDIIHAWRSRRELMKADLIWTHLEKEYLAAAFVLRLLRLKRPVLQGNTLWLFASWEEEPVWRQILYRFCLARVDVLTCNATPNISAGEALGLKPIAYVPYGISLDSFPLAAPHVRDQRTVAVVGNDRSRDWRIVENVAGACNDVAIRVASRVAPTSLSQFSNVTVAPANGVAEIRDLYDSAALVLVPTKPNAHASGITVILEAVARGVPVVAADEGGLADYFTGEEVLFYSPNRECVGAPEAVRNCLEDPLAAKKRAERAQGRFMREGYNSREFIKRLEHISRSSNVERNSDALEQPEPSTC